MRGRGWRGDAPKRKFSRGMLAKGSGSVTTVIVRDKGYLYFTRYKERNEIELFFERGFLEDIKVFRVRLLIMTAIELPRGTNDTGFHSTSQGQCN